MKQHTDWTDRLRDELRDAEIRPSEGGWERLLHDLEAAEGASGPMPAAPRRSFWSIYGPRIAAAAAVVLLGVVAGELLWHPDDPTATPRLAVETPRDGGALRDAVARASGWTRSPSDEAAGTSVELASAAGTAPAAGTSGETVPAAVASGKALRSKRTGANSGRMEPRQAVETAGSAADGQSAVSVVAQAVSRNATTDEAHAAGEGSEPDDSQTAGGRSTRSESRVTPQRTYRSAASDAEPLVEETSRRRSGTSLSLFAGGGASGSSSLQNTALRSYSVMANDVSLVGNGNNFSPMPRRDYDESSFRHHLPLSFGLSVRKELPRGFSLESGVVYTLLRSDVRLPYASDDVSQKLHLLGIPLRVNWRFVERGRFAAYLGAGGMVEKCISARFGSERVDEPALQWSLAGVVGAQYRLVDHVGLYFEPEASYYLTDTELQTSRSDAPLSLTLRLGVRVLF